MPVVQQDILIAFLSKLSTNTSIDAATVDGLERLLSSDKKLKVEDVVALLLNDSADGRP